VTAFHKKNGGPRDPSRQRAGGPEDVYDGLLQRIQHGDPAALAEFFIVIEMRFRRTFKQRLRPEVRRLHDSDDLWGEAYVRLDSFLHRGGFVKAKSGAELRGLAFRTAERIIAEWERQISIERRVALESHAAKLGANSQAEEIAPVIGAWPLCNKAIQLVDTARDRQLLALRARGYSWAAIGKALSVSAVTIRKRFERLRKRIGRVNDSVDGPRIPGARHPHSVRRPPVP
jgi:DNA-directed RNA polymerase specialized sigma24 family protein